jgi:hypothetical protein
MSSARPARAARGRRALRRTALDLTPLIAVAGLVPAALAPAAAAAGGAPHVSADSCSAGATGTRACSADWWTAARAAALATLTTDHITPVSQTLFLDLDKLLPGLDPVGPVFRSARPPASRTTASTW